MLRRAPGDQPTGLAAATDQLWRRRPGALRLRLDQRHRGRAVRKHGMTRRSRMSSRDTIQRSVLPIPDPQHVGVTTYDAKDPDTSFPPLESLRPPTGAPNVLIVLIDDCGFGAASAFGGPIATPNAERLAQGGLKLNRFHTTALCSPTRQALLTGRNHTR